MPERRLINVYADESCHLEGDGHPLMVLGAIAAPAERARELAEAIREIKQAHGMARTFEIKWTKISPAGVGLYTEILDLFLADADLRFRGLVAHGKAKLRHEDFGQDHATWYFKMYYELFRPVVATPNERFRIYIDIKGNNDGGKARTLHQVISRSLRDPNDEIVERVQIVRSDEVELLQLADLLVGALAYRNRGLQTNIGKIAIVDRLEREAGVNLTWSTAVGARKVNLFHWSPRTVTP